MLVGNKWCDNSLSAFLIVNLVKMSFSEYEEDQLINLVIKCPALYDISHNDYNDTVAKNNTWKKIGQQLDKGSDHCKRYWKLLRNSYSRYKKNNKLAFGSGAAIKNTKHKRYEQLKFLDGLIQIRPGSSKYCLLTPENNMTEWRDPLSPNELGNNEDNKTESYLEEVKVKIESVESDNDVEIVSSGEKISNETAVTTRVKPNKRSHEDATEHGKEKDAKRSFKRIAKKNDDIDLFCRHIGAVLRNLPPLDKAKAKKHLSDVISDYEILAASRSNNTFALHTSSVGTSSSLSDYLMSSSPNTPEPPETN